MGQGECSSMSPSTCTVLPTASTVCQSLVHADWLIVAMLPSYHGSIPYGPFYHTCTKPTGSAYMVLACSRLRGKTIGINEPYQCHHSRFGWPDGLTSLVHHCSQGHICKWSHNLVKLFNSRSLTQIPPKTLMRYLKEGLTIFNTPCWQDCQLRGGVHTDLPLVLGLTFSSIPVQALRTSNHCNTTCHSVHTTFEQAMATRRCDASDPYTPVARQTQVLQVHCNQGVCHDSNITIQQSMQHATIILMAQAICKSVWHAFREGGWEKESFAKGASTNWDILSLPIAPT